ncbi:MAG: CapA family protein [Solobacterium sp.]|nr:CapA family protein [Solobacterium sp.]
MNIKDERFNGTFKVLVILALVLGLVSLTMNFLSMHFESEQEKHPKPTSSAQSWTIEDEIHVINVFAAGTADYGTRAALPGEYLTMFGNVDELINNYNMAAYSQYSLLGMDLPASFGEIMTDMGFDMIGLANPESLKYGKKGIDASMEYWLTTDAHISGTNTGTDYQNQMNPFSYNDISAVFLSFTDHLSAELPESQHYLVNVYDDVKTPQIIAKARSMADIVVVSVFWDGEDSALPTDRQKEMAQAMADAGASVIIGNAPNAIQPAAWIDDTLIFYSMGSFISDDGDQMNRIGAVGAVTITETISGDSRRIELTNPRVDFVASVPCDNGYMVKMLNDCAENIEGKDDIYSRYSSVIQRMDDSIRIGGLQ